MEELSEERRNVYETDVIKSVVTFNNFMYLLLLLPLPYTLMFWYTLKIFIKSNLQYLTFVPILKFLRKNRLICLPPRYSEAYDASLQPKLVVMDNTLPSNAAQLIFSISVQDQTIINQPDIFLVHTS